MKNVCAWLNKASWKNIPLFISEWEPAEVRQQNPPGGTECELVRAKRGVTSLPKTLQFTARCSTSPTYTERNFSEPSCHPHLSFITESYCEKSAVLKEQMQFKIPPFLDCKKKKKIAELLPASSREGQNWKVLIQCTEPLFFFFHRKLVKVWETRLDSSERHKKMSYLRTSDILICTPSLKKRHSKQDKKQKHWEEQKAGSS